MTRSGKILLTFLAVFTAVSPYLADWKTSHIYNPDWPPHAKFYNAQTVTLAVLMAAMAIFFIWRSKHGTVANLPAAVSFVALY